VADSPRVVPFGIDDYTRWRLLEGLDDISLTLRHETEVSAFERSRPAWKPTTTPERIPR
jgi:3-isopropylmalate/(R)-2-methylmalate dehydratase small subunit